MTFSISSRKNVQKVLHNRKNVKFVVVKFRKRNTGSMNNRLHTAITTLAGNGVIIGLQVVVIAVSLIIGV